jgi:hypothetical protein
MRCGSGLQICFGGLACIVVWIKNGLQRNRVTVAQSVKEASGTITIVDKLPAKGAPWSRFGELVR